MSALLTIVPLWARLAFVAIVVAVCGFGVWKVKDAFDAKEAGELRLQQANMVADANARAFTEQAAKDKESQRRLDEQKRNQDAQDKELAAAHAAAARNERDADQLRDQNADLARQWAARLADSPSGEDLKAAGAALAVCTDVSGRLDRAASDLASYAQASRAAGLKCERDYDALTPKE